MSLQYHLESMFRPKRTKPAAGSYVAIRGVIRAPIRKRNGLWTCAMPAEAPGGPQLIQNSLLGDLKAQLADMGFDILVDREGL